MKELKKAEYAEGRGVVLQRLERDDGNLFLKMLTENGVLYLSANPAKSAKKGQRAITQPMTYLSFSYYTRGDMAFYREGILLHDFFSIAQDYDAYLTAMEMLRLCAVCLVENTQSDEELNLLLRGLYALQKGQNPKNVGLAFEMGLLCLEGFAPDLSRCCGCGKVLSHEDVLDITKGRFYCKDCFPKRQEEAPTEKDKCYLLSPDLVSFLRHMEKAPLETLFAFTLSDSSADYIREFVTAYRRYYVGD